MADEDRIYIDTCAFIDAAKFRAKIRMHADDDTNKEREKDVWTLTRILMAARAGAVKVYTSMLTIAECDHLHEIANGVAQPPDADTQRFFRELLTSGKSGVTLVQPTQTILESARDLRWKRSMSLKPMDAIHVASAIRFHCKEFFTRDNKIHTNREKILAFKMSVIPPNDTALLPPKFSSLDFNESLEDQTNKIGDEAPAD